MNRRRRMNTTTNKTRTNLSIRRRTIKKSTAATINARHNVYRLTIIKEAEALDEV